MKKLITGKRLLLALSFLAFISLGLPDGLLGVAWPSIAGEFGRPLSRLALLQLAATCGFFVSSTNAGRLIRRLGVGRLLILSNILVAAALAGFSFAREWPLIVASMVVLGTGGGAVDAGLNAYSAERFTKEQVTLLHAFYGLGAMIGPVIMRRVLQESAPWQYGYIATLSMVAVLLVLFVIYRNRWNGDAHLEEHSAAPSAGAAAPGSGAGSSISLRVRITGIVLFLVYTGLEVTAGGWTYTWLTRGRLIEPELAALWVGMYWAALMAGRVFFGFFGGRWHIRSILSWMISMVVFGALLFLQPWSAGAALLALPLLGFACAPLFPLFVSYTPAVAGRKSASGLIGKQVAAASVGSAVVPLLVGAGVEISSLRAIPVLLLALSLLLAAAYRLWIAETPRT
jgi:fucose permease